MLLYFSFFFVVTSYFVNLQSVNKIINILFWMYDFYFWMSGRCDNTIAFIVFVFFFQNRWWDTGEDEACVMWFIVLTFLFYAILTVVLVRVYMYTNTYLNISIEECVYVCITYLLNFCFANDWSCLVLFECVCIYLSSNYRLCCTIWNGNNRRRVRIIDIQWSMSVRRKYFMCLYIYVCWTIRRKWTKKEHVEANASTK